MGNSSNLKPQFVAKFVVKIGGDKGIVKKEKQHLWPQTTPPPPSPSFRLNIHTCICLIRYF